MSDLHYCQLQQYPVLGGRSNTARRAPSLSGKSAVHTCCTEVYSCSSYGYLEGTEQNLTGTCSFERTHVRYKEVLASP